MISERLKKLANQYNKDYWQLSKEEQEEVVNTFLFVTTIKCNCDETEVILRNCGVRVGMSYDYNDIIWKSVN